MVSFSSNGRDQKSAYLGMEIECIICTLCPKDTDRSVMLVLRSVQRIYLCPTAVCPCVSMCRLFICELNKRVHLVQEVERFLAFIIKGKL